MTEEPSNMILVINRRTGRVLDASSLEYSWRLDDIIQRHDLNIVDILIRKPTRTAALVLTDNEQLENESADIKEAPKEPSADIAETFRPQADPDEDVPF